MSSTATPSTSSSTPAPAEATPAAAAQATAAAAAADAAAPGKHDSASLYVGELALDVTEAILYEHFKTVGQVASIRVCRHAVTRISLGYAYVNYVRYEDAERALETLNHTEVKDRPIRIMWSTRDPTARRDGEGNVYIKNLHKTIEDKQLNDTFAQFGEILSCKIARNERGDSLGYGFVHFASKEAADLAIQTTNELEIQGKKLFVGPFQPRRDRQEKFTNLYVKAIPKSWTNEQLKTHFAGLGEVTSAVIMTDDSGASKGFGFVNYADPTVAANAIDVLGNVVPDGGDEKLYVGRAQKKVEREKALRMQRSDISSKFHGVNLYVKNLDEAIDDAKLNEAFKPFGQITSAHVMRTDKGASKGFGFVCYSTPEEAQHAIAEMHGKMFGAKPVYVAVHEPKDIRKAKLEAQYQARAAQRIPMMPGGPMFPVSPAAQPVFYGAQGMQRQPPFMFPQGGMPMPRQPGAGPRPPYGMPPNAGAMPHQAMRRPPQGGRGRGGPSSRGGAMRGRGGFKGGRMDDQANVPLNPATLASMTEEERRGVLGHALYAAVSPKNPANVKKIVGMLLEGMDTSEILAVLENESALDDKIQEAVEALTSAE